MDEKNTTRFIFGFLACFIFGMITGTVHLCFVRTTLLFLLGMTLRNIPAWVPLTHGIFKKATTVGQREQAEEA